MLKNYLLATLLISGIAVNGQEHKCATEKKLEMLKAQDPGLEQRMLQQEQQLQELIAKNTAGKQSSTAITIPVVVHVLYSSPVENISYAQVQSQITVLNDDFRRMNSDTTNIPAGFKPLAGDAQIEFCLASLDPNGNPTTGVTYTSTSTSMIGSGTYYSSAQGGHDAWDRDSYLNIWVCDIDGGSTLGFAYYPGTAPPPIDGVVVDYRFFGTMGTATPPFHLGRTATHEVGHWLNLIHIWGDDYCGDDQVSDTPPQAMSTWGCSTYPSYDGCTTTGDGIMFTNYMDYSDDNCLNMFTHGQGARMNAALTGIRTTLLTSNGCGVTTGIKEASVPVLQGYPNPLTSTSVIHLPNSLSNGTLHIYDIVGREVSLKNALEGTSVTIERNALNPGIYFFQLTENGKSVGKGKLVIE